METQTLTQTINIIIGGDGLADTGISLLPLLTLGLALIAAGALAWHSSRRSRKLSFRSLAFFSLFALAGTGLTLNLSGVSAAPALTLGTDQNNLTVTVPEGGGTASTTTTLTSGTTNADGYTLTAVLTEPEAGIDIKLKGGEVTTSTALAAGDPPLTLKTTDSVSSGDATNVSLDFTIDGTVTAGEKELKLAYVITDNEPTGPLTMQSFTAGDCTSLDVYDGTNEDAVITLSDPRGDGQTYQVAKLADNNCWMLDNLKLGSVTDTLTLTSSDTDVADDFILPQAVTTGTADYDNPGVYGPVPGDTGVGETNYGYLYNWSAATAGESRVSHPGGAGNAPHSICPANWRLPTGGATGEFAWLNAKMNDPDAGSPSTAGGAGFRENWQPDGPFKGVFAGGWWEGFFDGGFVWSSSAYPDPDYSNPAFYASFDPNGVYPPNLDERAYGFGVRCLLS